MSTIPAPPITAPAPTPKRKWHQHSVVRYGAFFLTGMLFTSMITGPAPNSETIEVTPQACHDALDYARDGFTLASEFGGHAGVGFGAAADFLDALMALDDAGAEQASRDLDRAYNGMSDVNDQLDVLRPRFQAASAACEG